MRLLGRMNTKKVIALFISIPLICGLLFLFAMLLWPEPRIGRGITPAYNADREQIGAAVAQFMSRPTNSSYNHTIGEVPVTSWVGRAADTISGEGVILGEIYYPIAICPLLTTSSPKGILKNIPASAHADNIAPGGANDVNFGADAQCVNASTHGSYKWYTTASGHVVSVCIGADCTNSSMDGFQDVYP